MNKITTRQIALAAIFAALYVAVNVAVPLAIPVGIGGLTISLSALIATLFGIVLGPYLGTAAALLGAAVSFVLTGMSPYNLPFLLSPPLNAFVSGALFYKKWKLAVIPFILLMVAFVFTPPVYSFGNPQVAIWVLWDKIIAVLLIAPLMLFRKRLSVGFGAALFFLLAFIGNQADNIWGSFAFALPQVYEGIYGMPLEAVQLAFLSAPFLYPAIRLLQAFIIMLIAVPLIRVLAQTNWMWSKDNILVQTPPQPSPTKA
ncbi:MAG: ECF transporter S component [Candidatus Bathyarchaeota archaeon]|nr:ECF transporter S component [Candidatus Bathyarchaeota archaeon]